MVSRLEPNHLAMHVHYNEELVELRIQPKATLEAFSEQTGLGEEERLWYRDTNKA